MRNSKNSKKLNNRRKQKKIKTKKATLSTTKMKNSRNLRQNVQEKIANWKMNSRTMRNLKFQKNKNPVIKKEETLNYKFSIAHQEISNLNLRKFKRV